MIVYWNVGIEITAYALLLISLGRLLTSLSTQNRARKTASKRESVSRTESVSKSEGDRE